MPLSTATRDNFEAKPLEGIDNCPSGWDHRYTSSPDLVYAANAGWVEYRNRRYHATEKGKAEIARLTEMNRQRA